MTKEILKCAENCFIRAAGSVLDMGATLYQPGKHGTFGHSDFEAIKSDWETTGMDIRTAFATYTRQHNVQK